MIRMDDWNPQKIAAMQAELSRLREQASKDARCIELLRAEVLAWRRAVECGVLARTGEASTRTDDPRIAASIELFNARNATDNAFALGATP